MSVSVSILIPCYNAEQWIGEAIESALARAHPHTEVVVYDDGSTDNSLQVIRQYEDRIRWGTGPNRGGGAARNWLLEKARYPWIQYLDADDYLEQDKIAKQIEALHSDRVPQNVDVLYGPLLSQHHEGNDLRMRFRPIRYPKDPWVSLVTWDLPQTGSPLWRKRALSDVGGWKEDQPVCQEHELYLRLLMADKRFVYHPSDGAVYRKWSEETVSSADKARMYRHRVEIIRRAEEYLHESGKMTIQRRQALDWAYLDSARAVWLFDRNWARDTMRRVDDISFRSFDTPTERIPEIYRWIYRFAGFDAAERAAAWKRSLERWFATR